MIEPQFIKRLREYDRSGAFYLLAKHLLRFIVFIMLLIAAFSLAVEFGLVNIRAIGMETEEPFIESKMISKAKEELINGPVKDHVIDEPVEIPFDEIVANMPIEERIKHVCESYGVPFDIALAIARLETGWFKSNAYLNKNNVGGLSRNEKPISFDSIDEGVEAFVLNLANNYIAIGLDTPEEIGRKYCPVNPEWAATVRKLMKYGYDQE